MLRVACGTCGTCGRLFLQHSLVVEEPSAFLSIGTVEHTETHRDPGDKLPILCTAHSSAFRAKSFFFQCRQLAWSMRNDPDFSIVLKTFSQVVEEKRVYDVAIVVIAQKKARQVSLVDQ